LSYLELSQTNELWQKHNLLGKGNNIHPITPYSQACQSQKQTTDIG